MKNRKSNSLEVDLDITDKSLIDFKKSKSISVATTLSDIKSSKIGELYDVKPIHDNIHRICQLKINGRSIKESSKSIPKYASKKICECLFEKNKALRIAELEKLVKNRQETPASSCISILDKYMNGSKKKKKSTKSTESAKSTKSTKSQKSQKSQKSTKSTESAKSTKSTKSAKSQKKIVKQRSKKASNSNTF
jgi:hypothetical protein